MRGNIRQRLSTNGNETDINDHYGHGTHMAGIIAASNSEISSIGIAPGAGIISIKLPMKNRVLLHGKRFIKHWYIP
ncbi:MAG: S8 family serine peptidase [Bacteroidetes bacterium]|nr:S8 family serine peptidase [Bacteroidota bacterium]